MDDEIDVIPTDDKQNYRFCILKLLLELFGYCWFKPIEIQKITQSFEANE